MSVCVCVFVCVFMHYCFQFSIPLFLISLRQCRIREPTHHSILDKRVGIDGCDRERKKKLKSPVIFFNRLNFFSTRKMQIRLRIWAQKICVAISLGHLCLSLPLHIQFSCPGPQEFSLFIVLDSFVNCFCDLFFILFFFLLSLALVSDVRQE